MILLQTTTDLKDVITTNDATVTGILIAVVLAFGATIIYLFKQNQSLHRDFISELKESNNTLITLNSNAIGNAQKFHDFARELLEIKNFVKDNSNGVRSRK